MKINEITDRLLVTFNFLREVFVWISPIVLVLLCLAYVFKQYGISFEHYLELIKVLVWPITILLVSYFFKKVFTYMFFSMDEFSFFGAKGRLKDVKVLIEERVEKSIRERDENEKSKSEFDKIKKLIDKKDGSIAKQNQKLVDAQKEASDNLNIAHQIFEKYSKYRQDSVKKIEELTSQIAELNNLVKQVSPHGSNVPELDLGERQGGSINELGGTPESK